MIGSIAVDHHTRQQRSAHSRAYRGHSRSIRPSAIPARRCSREPTERLGATVEHDGEPNASGIASVFPVVELGAAFDDAPRWHRRREPCGEHHGTRSPANPGFVHLNMVLGLSTDPVLVGPHHARADCGEFERPSRSAKDQGAAETARRTCRASDWRPDKRPRTRRSAVATLHHCSHRQPGENGGAIIPH